MAKRIRPNLWGEGSQVLLVSHRLTNWIAKKTDWEIWKSFLTHSLRFHQDDWSVETSPNHHFCLPITDVSFRQLVPWKRKRVFLDRPRWNENDVVLWQAQKRYCLL